MNLQLMAMPLPKIRRQRKPKPSVLRIENLGPIRQAEVAFGDLTVIVGPQATGKSIFLQTLKLVLDSNHCQMIGKEASFAHAMVLLLI